MNDITADVINCKDVTTRNKIIVKNMPLIYYALKRANVSITEDLIQESVIVFIDAIKKYKQRKKASFSTYLINKIKFAAMIYDVENKSVVKANYNDYVAAKKDEKKQELFNNAIGKVCAIEASYDIASNDTELALLNLNKFTKEEQVMLNLRLSETNFKTISMLLDKPIPICKLISLSVRNKIEDQLR